MRRVWRTIRPKQAVAGGLLLLCCGIAGLFIAKTHADTFFVPGEAETGQLQGNAAPITDVAASGGGAVAFGQGGGILRLFSAGSAWNSVANGTADPNSDAYTSNGSSVGSLQYAFTANGKNLDIAGTDDYPDYGIPFYMVDASTPKVQVKDSTGWWGGMQAPIPSGAQPAIGTDHHLSVLDGASRTLYEFWDMHNNGDGTWSAGMGSASDANGLGYQTANYANGARAYGGSLIAGAIMYDEMKAGAINHALGMAYNFTGGAGYAHGLGKDGVNMNIASHSDAHTDGSGDKPGSIPEGAHLRLKPSVDVSARCGSNNACKVIGAALQRYGAFMVDYAGVPTLYSQTLTGTGKSWSGVLSITDARAFQGGDFELLSLPQELSHAP